MTETLNIWKARGKGKQSPGGSSFCVCRNNVFSTVLEIKEKMDVESGLWSFT